MANKTQSTITLEDGKEIVVQHPEGWSKQRVRLFALQNQPTSVKPAVADNTDPVTSADLLQAGILDIVPDFFLKYALDVDRLADYNEFQAAREQFIRESVGIPADYELSTTEKIVRAAGDPFTYVGVGKTGAKTLLGQAVGSVGQLGEALLTTAGAVSAAESAQDLTGIPAIDEILSSSLGILGGTATGVAASGTRVTAAAPFKAAEEAYVAAKQAAGKENYESISSKTNALSEYLAEKSVQNQINIIKNTTSPDEVARAINKIDEIKEFVPNLEMDGLAGALVDNPAVQDWMRKTAQHSPEFIAEMKKQATSNLEVLTDKLGEFTNVLGRVDETELYNVSETVFNKMLDKLEAQENARIEKFEEDMTKLTLRLDAESPDVVGQRAKELSNKVETELRAQADKLYDAATAGAAKIDLPIRYVTSLAKVAQTARTVDPFGVESRTAKQLRDTWMPKQTTETLDGVEVDIATVPPVKLTDLVSLKRAINTDLNKQYKLQYTDQFAPQRIEKLQVLKANVEGVIKDLQNNPETRMFARNLKKADKFYYEKLGLPMRASGMARINATQFNKDAAAHLTNDTQKARDYLAFVGEREGKQVLKHAMRMKAEKEVISEDGSVSPQKLRNFVRKKTNAELIELAGMGREFSNLLRSSKTIRGTRERQQKHYNEQVKKISNGFFKSILNKNLNSVVREMTSNPKRRREILNEISSLNKNNKELIMAGIRNAFVTEGMIKTDKPLAKYMEDNRSAVIDIFGETYLSDLNKFGEIYDAVNKIDAAINRTLGSDPTMDLMQQYVGISAAQALGYMRNQVLSTQRKILNAGSVIFQSKAQKRYYKLSAEMLQDPEVIRKLANPTTESWNKTKAVLKAIKAGKEISAELLRDTVVPYYRIVLNDAGIFSSMRSFNAVAEEELEGAEAPQ